MKTATAIFLSFLVFGVAACANLETQPRGDGPARAAQSPNSQPGKNGRGKQDKRQAANKTPQVKAMLAKLVVADEATSAYSRADFPHWSDLDGDGCDTRKEVLSRENRKPTGDSCDAYIGEWYSPYDQVTTTDPSKFDVDHMVPLSEAWDSGADRWDRERREKYANDLHPYSLIAVSASSNRSKSDQDPAEWMPENKAFTCQYTARWIAVKFRWRLTVDQAEKDALSQLVDDCPDRKLTLTTSIAVTKKAAMAPNEPEKKTSSANNKKTDNAKPELDPIFSSCAEAISKGYGPYRKNDPEYGHYRDADGDGIVCER